MILTRCTGLTSQIEAEGFRVLQLPLRRKNLNPFKELDVLAALYRIFSQEKPDIVHQVAIKPILYGSLVGLFCRKIRFINAYAGLGTIFIRNSLKYRILRLIVVTLLRIAQLNPRCFVICQNQDDYDILKNFHLLSDSRACIISGSGVNLSKFLVINEPSPDVIRVVLVARMLWDKGIQEFLDAAIYLKTTGTPFEFMLVGAPDPESPEVVSTSLLESWQASGILRWLGHQTEIADIYQQSHIAVLPSYREGLPKALLEAAACGKPIVATDVAGCREIVREGVNGFLVPAKESRPLAEAILRLAQDAKLRDKFGQEGRKLVETYFSDSIICRKTLDFYTFSCSQA